MILTSNAYDHYDRRYNERIILLMFLGLLKKYTPYNHFAFPFIILRYFPLEVLTIYRPLAGSFTLIPYML